MHSQPSNLIKQFISDRGGVLRYWRGGGSAMWGVLIILTETAFRECTVSQAISSKSLSAISFPRVPSRKMRRLCTVHLPPCTALYSSYCDRLKIIRAWWLIWAGGEGGGQRSLSLESPPERSVDCEPSIYLRVPRYTHPMEIDGNESGIHNAYGSLVILNRLFLGDRGTHILKI